MKPVKYPETIFCDSCHSPVRMLRCKVLDNKVKGRVLVEFDTVCVTCGSRSSAARDWEYLQYSEREFCQTKGLAVFSKAR